MSLTETEAVFAGVHETALNDILTAFCNDRPRYLVYGSPAFVPVTTVAETSIAAIPFPGIPGGIQWRIRLSVPHIDLFKQSSALPTQLSLKPGEFSAQLAVELCLDCKRLRIDPKPPRPKDEQSHNPQPDDRHPAKELTCFKLRVFAIGHLEHVMASTGEDAVALAVDVVELVDIQPDDVETFLECLLFMILQAVLGEIRLPLRALRAGAFQLSLVVGPFIDDDQIKLRGNV